MDFDNVAGVESALKALQDGRKAYLTSEGDRLRVQQQLERLASAFKKRRGAWTRKLGVPRYSEAMHALRRSQQAFDFGRATAGLLNGTMAFEVREKAMAENATWYADQEKPGVRIVVWAHNSHVSLEDASGRKSMGGYLREKYGRKVLVIGTLFGDGGFQALDKSNPIGMREFVLGAPSKWDVGQPFLALGVRFFAVDLRVLKGNGTRWFAAPHVVREVGLSFAGEAAVSTVRSMGRRFDAVVFIAHTSRATLVPNLDGPPLRK